jgi:hypothetical protein
LAESISRIADSLGQEGEELSRLLASGLRHY